MIFNHQNKPRGLTPLNSRRANLTGFTLLETIFAVAIILIAVIAIFALVNFGISSIRVSKNKLIAAELAQEGQELVRWWRESSGPVVGWDGWYLNQASLKGYFRTIINPANPSSDVVIERCTLVAACPGTWTIDTYGPVINSLSDLHSWFGLWYDPASQIYNHNAVGEATNFFRIIHISSPQDVYDVGDNDKKVITVEVFWQDVGRLRSLKVVDHLYNWW